MNKRYISCADTAKLIRQSLKEAFSSIKFSVRSSSYSMGASVDVRWADGPTTKQVDAVVERFEGCYFDGMTDYKGYVTCAINGEPVSFGANFIHTNRSVSDELVEAAMVELEKVYGRRGSVEAFNNGDLNRVPALNGADDEQYWSIQSACNRVMSELSMCESKPSPTADSVTVLGTDGYGQSAKGVAA